MTDLDKLKKLREDPQYFKNIYNDHRGYSLRFMSKIHSDYEDIQDVYQDSVLVLYEKLKSPDFQLTHSIQTYLNSICRNQLITKHRKNSRMYKVDLEDYDSNITDWFNDLEYSQEKEERLTTFESALETFKEASKQCYELLRMQYYEHFNMNKIATLLGFSNASSAKSQASKCRGKLKELALKEYASK